MQIIKNIYEKMLFFIRVAYILHTWGYINAVKFIPYEIYYWVKFNKKTMFSIIKEELDATVIQKKNANPYIPTPYYIAHKVFNIIKLELKNSEFVDFGCGAGRILMFALKYNPERVIGLDISKKLCLLAEGNLNSYCKTNNINISFEILNIDAVNYEISKSTSIFYFYDPIENKSRMGLVVNNIVESTKIYPRKIIIIYVTPIHSKLFIDAGFIELYTKINKYKRGYTILELNT